MPSMELSLTQASQLMSMKLLPQAWDALQHILAPPDAAPVTAALTNTVVASQPSRPGVTGPQALLDLRLLDS